MTSLPDRPRRRTGPTIALIVALGLGLVVVAAAARVGWGYLERHRTYAPSTPLADQCDDVPADAERVRSWLAAHNVRVLEEFPDGDTLFALR